ncbi:MAG TPA: DUF58 domain-containing protein [Acidimicrobiales bacterium]
MTTTSPLRSAQPARSPSQVPLAHLELTVLRRLDGLLQGDHSGLLPGHGSESGEARPYVAGDDPRRMDWAVTARTSEPHVRDTIADHELELWLVVDTSASLDFGTACTTKADIAWAAGGAVALLATRGGNRVGVVAAGGKQKVIPARGGRAHVGAALAAVRHAQDGATGSGDLGSALSAVRRSAKRRGMVVVVSDFLDAGAWDRPLRALSARHEVLAIEVVDPREMELPDVGLLHLTDPETGRRRMVDTGSDRLRARFREAAGAQRDAIRARLRAAGTDHLLLRTDRDWVVDLVRFVAGRKARRAAAGGNR